MSKLSDLYNFQYGKGNNNPDNGGQYPIYGSNGIIGWYDKYNSIDSPVIGHIGANCGEVVFGKGKHFVTYNGIICSCKKNVDPMFAYYTLLNCRLKDRVRGSAQPFVSYDLLNRVNVNIPDLKTQKRIGGLLSNLDKLIEENNKRIKEYLDYSETLYNYWFRQFEFPNKDNKPYSSNGGEMVQNDSINQLIPKQWKVKKLVDALDVFYGYPFNTDEFTEESGDPVIRIRDILNNTISAYTTEKVDKKYYSKSNDLLIGMDGNFHMNFWYRNGDLINQRIAVIRRKDISPLQAYFAISPYIKKREANVARSTVGHLSDKDIKKLYVIVPDDAKLVKVFDDLLNVICSLKSENEKLENMKQYILPILINGQISIKEA